jgi:molecular chaperone GrpE
MLKKDKTGPVKDLENFESEETAKYGNGKTDNSADTNDTDNPENIGETGDNETVDTDIINGDNVNEQQTHTPDPKDLIIKELNDKVTDLNDKYLRLFSDFDNFRKRSIKERLELTKTASAEMIEAILPVLDDLERALQVEGDKIDSSTEGITLIIAKLKRILSNKGLEEIKTIGEVFNTDFHEAITHIPAPDEKKKGQVIDEVQKGYLLNGKVLRFAKVIVAN